MIKNARDYGAVGDGIANDTKALNNALLGGGTVVVPPGVYLTGTLYLESNTTLIIESGAVIRAIRGMENYNAVNFCPQNRDSKAEVQNGCHLITAVETENIRIEGGGIIDGNYGAWEWKMHSFQPCYYPQPADRNGQLIFICECRNFSMTGVHLMNSTYWTLFLHGCENVRLSDLNIESPHLVLNTDGIDIDCCCDVVINNCIIRTGDDCIAVRGNPTPLKNKRDCKNICVSNCILSSAYANAIRVGVGEGYIHDCNFSNIIVDGAKVGINLVAKFGSSQNNGTCITDLTFSDFRMDVKRPFMIELDDYYGNVPYKSKNIFEHIDFNNFRIRGYLSSFIFGNGAGIIRDINFNNVKMLAGGNGREPGVDEHGLWCVDSTEAVFDITSSAEVNFINCSIGFEADERPSGWEYDVRSIDSVDINMINCNFVKCKVK